MGSTILPRLVSLTGLVVMLGIALALSENRKRVNWRLVLWGVGLQFAIGVAILLTPLEGGIFAGMRGAVGVLTESALQGEKVVFGTLAEDLDIGATFAFQVLPVIIFVSAIAAILYHLRIVQTVVQMLTFLMRRTLKTSGAETFCAGLLIFLGIESATAVRGYLKTMTRSELCTIMTTFMATIAGSVMIVYATFGAEPGHLLAASLMSAPAAIVISKLMVPEVGDPETRGSVRISVPVESHNLVDAISRGTSDGLMMALNVGAMLIVFIGLVHLLNIPFNAIVGRPFEVVVGWLFWPFAALLGVPLSDVPEVAQLLGKKTVLNEFLAYLDLQASIGEGALSKRSITIATYALCGFANPGSLGIAIAGMAGLVPERRAEITQLGLRAFIGGTLACFTTACVAGVLLFE
ncbi:MAG: NupC/NupG family nucleoside CNT transporter [bacterium]|nr:NupC/NupG family nucleoside CNT transporter [bacterium]